MAISEADIRAGVKRIMLSRMRILTSNGFYGLLLMHMKFNLDEECETAATDGVRIYFGPQFLSKLSNSELDFVLMHEIMHVVLRHCLRTGERDSLLFNIACDIVVNSNILLSNGMDLSTITLREFGESMHIAPDGNEGYMYTAEEVYEMYPASKDKRKGNKGNKDGDNNSSGKDGGGSGKETQGTGKTRVKGGKNGGGGREGWDDHSRWGTVAEEELLEELWVKRFEDACEAIKIRDSSNERGLMPLFARRMLEDMHGKTLDWRSILADFVQEEVVDYSFSPPDRRYDGGDFYLPDFNDTELSVKDILFMIDTSGSMSDKEVAEAYDEVRQAIGQFGSRLRGWLGFFDAAIIEPKPFSDIGELGEIKAAGGGGTDFGIIFRYARERMTENPPVSIIIMTDGRAPFPQESAANSVPVLWLITNNIVEPPWGRTARICD